MGNKEVQGCIRLLGTRAHEEAVHQQALGDRNEASSVPTARNPNKTLSIFKLHLCATGHLVSLRESGDAAAHNTEVSRHSFPGKQ